MSKAIESSYDALPYRGQAFAFTHPDHLFTVATLMGLDPPHPDNCRVLELGCGDGRNLLPMAGTLSSASLVGLDLAAAHIEEATELAESVGLENVRFEQMNLMDLPTDFGEFDYIICHGVYSWVPPAVQERILEICSLHLSPTGVALVSFNTFPGWHSRRMIRDMTRLHADRVDSHVDKMQAARQFLDAFSVGISGQSNPYSQLIGAEVEKAKGHADFYFFHEHLEEFNFPCYLHEFAGRAAKQKLTYVSDVELTLTLPPSGDAAVEQYIAAVSSDRVSRDQHLDFLTNRTFRKALICRQSCDVSLDPMPERLLRAQVSSGAKPEAAGNLHDQSEMSFVTYDGIRQTAHEPLVKAAFLRLTEVSPQQITGQQLLEDARAMLRATPQPADNVKDAELLTHWLLRTHRNNPASIVHVSCVNARHASSVSEHPKGSPVACKLASQGEVVTNYRHEPLKDDPTYLSVLPLLDGTHNRNSMVAMVQDLLNAESVPRMFPDVKFHGKSGRSISVL